MVFGTYYCNLSNYLSLFYIGKTIFAESASRYTMYSVKIYQQINNVLRIYHLIYKYSTISFYYKNIKSCDQYQICI